jgi:putative oxidoreductase
MADEKARTGKADWGLLIIRIGLGLTFVFLHGGPKLIGGPGKWSELGKFGMAAFGVESGLAFWGFAAALFELLGGLGILLGILTLPASLLILVIMIFACVAHVAAGQYMKAAYPFEIGIVMIGLLLTGPGRLSLGRLWKRKPRESDPGGAQERE